MRAVRYHEYGPPSVLRVEEVEEPHASADSIRIATSVVSVNPIDTQVRSGALRGAVTLPFPITPGRDAAGVVDEVGADVDGVEIGDLVFGLGGTQDTYTSHAVLGAWAKIPSNWTPAQGASAALAAATARHAVQALGQVSDATILVEGAAGSVGTALCAFLLDAGARVIGTGRPANHERLRALGVTPVEYGPGLTARVAAAAPDGVNGVVDTAASGSLAELVDIVGTVDQAVTVADANGSSELGVTLVFGENDTEALEYAARLGAQGAYSPFVTDQFGVDDVVQAHELAQNGRPAGKVVIEF